MAEIGRSHGFQVTTEELSTYAASQPLSGDALDGVAAAGFGFTGVGKPRFVFARGADIIEDIRAEGPFRRPAP